MYSVQGVPQVAANVKKKKLDDTRCVRVYNSLPTVRITGAEYEFCLIINLGNFFRGKNSPHISL